MWAECLKEASNHFTLLIFFVFRLLLFSEILKINLYQQQFDFYTMYLLFGRPFFTFLISMLK